MKTENNALERQLETFYIPVPPPPGELAAGRERLLAEAVRFQQRRPARPVVQAKRSRRKNVTWVFAYKVFAAVLAVIVGTAGIGGGAAMVAADSLPGDRLYSYKLVVEDVKVALASQASTRAELYLDFATERANEIDQLAERSARTRHRELNWGPPSSSQWWSQRSQVRISNPFSNRTRPVLPMQQWR